MRFAKRTSSNILENTEWISSEIPNVAIWRYRINR